VTDEHPIRSEGMAVDTLGGRVHGPAGAGLDQFADHGLTVVRGDACQTEASRPVGAHLYVIHGAIFAFDLWDSQVDLFSAAYDRILHHFGLCHQDPPLLASLDSSAAISRSRPCAAC
jgi:hypothetical protein